MSSLDVPKKISKSTVSILLDDQKVGVMYKKNSPADGNQFVYGFTPNNAGKKLGFKPAIESLSLTDIRRFLLMETNISKKEKPMSAKEKFEIDVICAVSDIESAIKEIDSAQKNLKRLLKDIQKNKKIAAIFSLK
jgi:hypothetical protein